VIADVLGELSPMVTTGLSEVIGSWNTIAISAPHRAFFCLDDFPISSSPAYVTEPVVTELALVLRPMIERDSTVLPEPDSPTTPSVRPRASENDTPSTARTAPAGTAKCVLRSSTTNSD
jgi:hypothetical protein